MPTYSTFGLTLSTDIDFPELQRTQARPIDVTLAEGKVDPSGLAQPTKSGVYYQTAPDRLWMHVPDIAWFQVQDGRQITYQPDTDGDTDADRQSIRLYLLGSCLGAVLHQRRYLVMHGNAVGFGPQCVMFAGPSGNGKSTLAAAFHQRGHPILADDVCAIDSQLRVLPAYPQLKLWHHSAKKLEIDVAALRPIRCQIKKYAYPLTQGFSPDPLPLAAVYFLCTHNQEDFLFEPITGMERFNPLKYNTYRHQYLEGFGLQTHHLKQCGRLAGQVHVTRITRPNHRFELDRLVELILDDLKDKGLVK